jgi:hypothetical protein
MLRVDCTELTADEKLALASEISDALGGKAIALSQGDHIVLDQLTDEAVTVDAVQPIVSGFLSRRREGEFYWSEVQGETIVVHSADPIAASHRKPESTLPPNLRQCPYCSFITEYEEEYVVHTRSHLFGV